MQEKSNNEKSQKFLNEIKKILTLLPRWVKVAFAARCARRLLPLYTMTWSESVPREELSRNVNNLEKFISIAETSAAKTTYASDVPQTKWRAYVNPMIVEALPAFKAIEAAYIADGNVSDYNENIDATILQQFNMCNGNAVPYDMEEARKAILSDIKFLFRESTIHSWTDETPVHKEIFGGMWPDGEPEDWQS
ncbi:MAG: hypothetical protein A2Y10_14820 [Planctomycetes bacterium GWF2_41_51]|nr:MAG: hypothetical protein A2Y10_14820 [Planctomycetes bacterium GWF2_41_51]HBG28984.1 hypothetical protein [Phycisphaerales bacterium]